MDAVFEQCITSITVSDKNCMIQHKMIILDTSHARVDCHTGDDWEFYSVYSVFLLCI